MGTRGVSAPRGAVGLSQQFLVCRGAAPVRGCFLHYRHTERSTAVLRDLMFPGVCTSRHLNAGLISGLGYSLDPVRVQSL